MKTETFKTHGVVAVVYWFDKGEQLPWHEHPWSHGHSVLTGRTQVELAGGSTFERKPRDFDFLFPAGIAHQITALEDGTVFVNAITEAIANAPPPPKVNRVLMADGTVVETDG